MLPGPDLCRTDVLRVLAVIYHWLNKPWRWRLYVRARRVWGYKGWTRDELAAMLTNSSRED